MNFKLSLASGLICAALATSSSAGFLDIFKGVLDDSGSTGDTMSVLKDSSPAAVEVTAGLKEALAKGVENAINSLGKPNGFLGNKLVEIAMPDSLKTVADVASKAGGKQYVDSFISSMNRAAEQATPQAATILSDAIREMTLDDAMSILNGPDDAATQYFRKSSGKRLEQSFLPIIKKATDSAGVTLAYKELQAQGAGMLGNTLGGLLGVNTMDLDQYVTGKTLDGLFKYIAMEEKQIRTDPVARSTDLLKSVFGR